MSLIANSVYPDEMLHFVAFPCADPGIFVRGGPGQSDKKSSFQRNLSFFKVPEGVEHFPGWVQLFPGGGGGWGVQ